MEPSRPADPVGTAASFDRENIDPTGLDPLVLVISRTEVECGETSSAIGLLKELTRSPEVARSFHNKVDIVFHGYDQESRELFEIPEVRNFVYQLDEQFPFWLFFLSKRHIGLTCLLLCFLPPSLTDQARARIFPEHINKLLSSRWFPAMNHLCEFVGMSKVEIEQLTHRVVEYINTGPLEGE